MISSGVATFCKVLPSCPICPPDGRFPTSRSEFGFGLLYRLWMAVCWNSGCSAQVALPALLPALAVSRFLPSALVLAQRVDLSVPPSLHPLVFQAPAASFPLSTIIPYFA